MELYSFLPLESLVSESDRKFPSPYGVIFILTLHDLVDNCNSYCSFRLLMELYSFLRMRNENCYK